MPVIFFLFGLFAIINNSFAEDADVSGNEEKAEIIQYNPELEKSVFPLQDQIRFRGEDVKLDLSRCGTEDEIRAVYNLQQEEENIVFKCISRYNSSCFPSCFNGGFAFDRFEPRPDCDGQLQHTLHVEDDIEVLDEEQCLDKHENLIWKRELSDNIVFDNQKHIIFYRDGDSVKLFKDKIITRHLVYSQNEFLFDDYSEAEAFFHVKYVRDSKGNVIRETHYNRSGFPYMIYEAEYAGGKCQKIIKINPYNGEKTEYLF